MLFHIKKYAWNFSDTFSPLLPPQGLSGHTFVLEPGTGPPGARPKNRCPNMPGALYSLDGHCPVVPDARFS